ncbi:hypothetical protein HK096_005166 [Nowakowskiella sp. JEL0078]|nr:hypothetical protein HK096_005166 [Nowakowskiella sp. JEL0078]
MIADKHRNINFSRIELARNTDVFSRFQDFGIIHEFISNLHQKLAMKTFTAVDSSGKQTGTITCQIWNGPLPLIVDESVLHIGTFWALTGVNDHIQQTLVRKAVEHLKTLKINKIVANVEMGQKKNLEKLGFTHGNALICLLDSSEQEYRKSSLIREVPGISIETLGEEADDLVVSNWVKMWKENGVTKEFIQQNYEKQTLDFIKDARLRLNYQTFGAVDVASGQTIGTVSCQLLSGTMPQCLAPKSGSVWAVYVEPLYRKRGIAFRLIQELKVYFKSLGMDRISLIYASEAGRRVYERCGFTQIDMMILDKPEIENLAIPYSSYQPSIEVLTRNSKMLAELREIEPDCPLRDSELQLLLTTVPYQLNSIKNVNPAIPYDSIRKIQQNNGVLVDENDNWFTQNLSKLGRGFDLNTLSQNSERMASKFNRLASHWEDFVTGCGYSPVFEWLCSLSYTPLSHLPGITVSSPSSDTLCVVDICSGIGLPGHTLRLTGFCGHLIGCDISPGMLDKAAQRACFDELYVTDANVSLCVASESADVIVCSGAMELLDIPKVLSLCYQALKPKAELWVSFQWDNGLDKPTSHQNVNGLLENTAIDLLKNNGFKVLSVLKCDSAFVTPKPSVDEESFRLVDVPYLFYQACKE